MGNKIRTARVAAGMKQEDLAAELRVGRNAVIKWEKATDARSITPVNRQNLEQLLGISLSDTDEAEPLPPPEELSDAQLLAELGECHARHLAELARRYSALIREVAARLHADPASRGDSTDGHDIVDVPYEQQRGDHQGDRQQQ